MFYFIYASFSCSTFATGSGGGLVWPTGERVGGTLGLVALGTYGGGRSAPSAGLYRVWIYTDSTSINRIKKL